MLKSNLRKTAAIAPLTLGLLVSPIGPSRANDGPPPIPTVQSVTEIGTVGQNPDIYGRDGTFSALVQGRSVWTFGDTVLAVPGVSGDSWDNNSLSWTTDLDASNGLALEGDRLDSTGAPAEFLPLTQDERAYNQAHDPDHCTAEPCGAEFALWGGPVVADPDRNRTLFFYMEIWRIVGNPRWRTVGTGIAVQTADGRVVRPIENPGSPNPTLMWGASEVGFAGGAMVVGSTIYAYGCTAGFLVQHCQVGRVPLAGALDRTQWRYYAGSGVWSSNASDAVTVFDGGSAANTVFFSSFLGDYVVIYGGVFSDDVFYRVSATPWGPWSDQTFLFTGKPGWGGKADYAAQAHPEFAQGDGQIQYVTYVHTTGFLRMDLPVVQVVFGAPGP